ncbi:hypothetical protein [Streptomyces sp. NK08204]|uniref:hypothetical protein n=1 Tax=Streptomyces sp. NK08204 TaxID=2873260 RepID=UPI001CED6D4D|nr:hypothetical protein [Streptomyces sp. NK08204]
MRTRPVHGRALHLARRPPARGGHLAGAHRAYDWTTDHQAGEERNLVGAFTISGAGGVLPDPGTRLPDVHDEGAYGHLDQWDGNHRHDVDHAVAIDCNRLAGTPPQDSTRPWGEDRGGGIWWHLDHGSGISACVRVSRKGMELGCAGSTRPAIPSWSPGRI